MPTNPAILIVGGAGYIGSHMVRCVRDAGFEVVVLDNLSTGHADAVIGAHFIQGDMQDTALLARLFAEFKVQAVMHFAAFIQVGESVQDPHKYYLNNVAGTLHLLDAMLKAQVKYFIFSSTAAVYGEPEYTPMDEKHRLQPMNPYGQGKRMIETILADYAASYDFNYGVLRYFNAAGAAADGSLCERHDPETHLIPLVLQVAAGERESIAVYGQDYPTPDGTCVRDYVHVDDLCQAHLLLLRALMSGRKTGIYNLGTGYGFSVQEVIDAACEVTGKVIKTVASPKRAGDPAYLVADASLAKQELGWQPHYTDLHRIIQQAWVAYQNRLSVVSAS